MTTLLAADSLPATPSTVVVVDVFSAPAAAPPPAAAAGRALGGGEKTPRVAPTPLFMALHMMSERMAPEAPMRAPTTVSRLLERTKPSAHSAQPLALQERGGGGGGSE
jgi:hypothetical protein